MLNAGNRNEASQMAIDWIKIAKCTNFKLIARYRYGSNMNFNPIIS